MSPFTSLCTCMYMQSQQPLPLQVVCDNKDFGEETLSGKGTTHNTLWYPTAMILHITVYFKTIYIYRLSVTYWLWGRYTLSGRDLYYRLHNPYLYLTSGMTMTLEKKPCLVQVLYITQMGSYCNGSPPHSVVMYTRVQTCWIYSQDWYASILSFSLMFSQLLQ